MVLWLCVQHNQHLWLYNFLHICRRAVDVTLPCSTPLWNTELPGDQNIGLCHASTTRMCKRLQMGLPVLSNGLHYNSSSALTQWFFTGVSSYLYVQNPWVWREGLPLVQPLILGQYIRSLWKQDRNKNIQVEKDWEWTIQYIPLQSPF